MINELFQTRNRRLEQFLYIHDIRFVSCIKDHEGMTVWLYEPTPELNSVVKEWREIQKRKEAIKERTWIQ